MLNYRFKKYVRLVEHSSFYFVHFRIFDGNIETAILKLTLKF